MGEESPLLRSLGAAVEAAPEDIPLRLHLARLLLDGGRTSEAIAHLGVALHRDPGSAEARALMAEAVIPADPRGEAPRVEGSPDQTARGKPTSDEPVEEDPPAQEPASAPEFDWQSAERDIAGSVPPRFMSAEPEPEAEAPDDGPAADAWDVESVSDLRLADVGGMREVKDRLEAAFLAPLRNPKLRRLFAKSLRGGLLLYGPPGCGKTFLARAVAGELGARFLSVSISDVLDMWIGASERNISEVFASARRNAPCVLFFDELDALGGKRSQMRHSGMRNTVNQLLTELDGVAGAAANEGVFVLAATNHPWDVDNALLRPGRLDRMVLVALPDPPAREAILRYHLRDRPVAGIELGLLVRRTDGYSGADLAHLCETAAERALLDSVRSGEPRMIVMRDLLHAADEVRPSTEEWFTTARTVATFRESGGAYRELLDYLKRTKRL